MYLNMKELFCENNNVNFGQIRLSRKIPQPTKIGKPSESFPKRHLLKLEISQLSMVQALYFNTAFTPKVKPS